MTCYCHCSKLFVWYIIQLQLLQWLKFYGEGFIYNEKKDFIMYNGIMY